MRIAFNILFVLLAVNSLGQNRKYLIDVNTREPFVYEDVEASEQRLDLAAIDEEHVCGAVFNKLNEVYLRKYRLELQQDSLLNSMCKSAVETFSNSRYKSRKSFQKEMKNFRYVLKIKHSKNRLFSAYAINIDLLDLPSRDKFYCDKRVKTSAINLYRGSPPKIRNTNHPDYVEPEPLYPKRESQMVEATLMKLKAYGAMRDLFSKKFTNFGLALRMDKRSLNRNRRPRLYLICIFSGKQNNYMKKKDKSKRLLTQDELYE